MRRLRETGAGSGTIVVDLTTTQRVRGDRPRLNGNIAERRNGSVANAFRLAALSRRQLKVVRMRVVQAVDPDSPGGPAVTPHELQDIFEALDGNETYAALVDINDARGKATYPETVRALNAEYDAWLERMPELPPAA
jgi:hypothetical protein